MKKILFLFLFIGVYRCIYIYMVDVKASGMPMSKTVVGGKLCHAPCKIFPLTYPLFVLV